MAFTLQENIADFHPVHPNSKRSQRKVIEFWTKQSRNVSRTQTFYVSFPFKLYCFKISAHLVFFFETFNFKYNSSKIHLFKRGSFIWKILKLKMVHCIQEEIFHLKNCQRKMCLHFKRSPQSAFSTTRYNWIQHKLQSPKSHLIQKQELSIWYLDCHPRDVFQLSCFISFPTLNQKDRLYCCTQSYFFFFFPPQKPL